MIVVDTNVIGHLFLSSEQSLLAEYALQKDSEWAAPILWRSELRNVLTLYVRKNIITLEQAQRIMNGALELLRGNMRFHHMKSCGLHRKANVLLMIASSSLPLTI